MSIINLLSFSNDLLDQLNNLAPKVIAFAAIFATLVPESTPYIGLVLHKIAFNIGKAENK
jgi:hypothetical protein